MCIARSFPPAEPCSKSAIQSGQALLDGARALGGLGVLAASGFDIDLEVRVDTATLYRVYLGQAELGGAMRMKKLTMSGPRALQRGFGRWFAWSAFAPASRLAEQRRGGVAARDLDSVRIAE